jgi:acyl-CoA synthetase (AMP-forming)/AMP-acid ligase II
MGLLRSHITVFPISPRFSASVLAHLLKETKATHIIVGSEPLLRQVLAEALGTMNTKSIVTPDVIEMPTFGALYADRHGSNTELIPSYSVDFDSTAIILHTSS